MQADLSQLHARIDALFDEPDKPGRLAAAAEDLLCDGYAAALELDAAHARAQQRIDELLAASSGAAGAVELRQLARARDDAAAQAAALRARLETLRTRIERRRLSVPAD